MQNTALPVDLNLSHVLLRAFQLIAANWLLATKVAGVPFLLTLLAIFGLNWTFLGGLTYFLFIPGLGILFVILFAAVVLIPLSLTLGNLFRLATRRETERTRRLGFAWSAADRSVYSRMFGAYALTFIVSIVCNILFDSSLDRKSLHDIAFVYLIAKFLIHAILWPFLISWIVAPLTDAPLTVAALLRLVASNAFRLTICYIILMFPLYLADIPLLFSVFAFEPQWLWLAIRATLWVAWTIPLTFVVAAILDFPTQQARPLMANEMLEPAGATDFGIRRAS